MKSIFRSFWRAINWWKSKNLMKIADTSFKAKFSKRFCNQLSYEHWDHCTNSLRSSEQFYTIISFLFFQNLFRCLERVIIALRRLLFINGARFFLRYFPIKGTWKWNTLDVKYLNLSNSSIWYSIFCLLNLTH